MKLCKNCKFYRFFDKNAPYLFCVYPNFINPIDGEDLGYTVNGNHFSKTIPAIDGRLSEFLCGKDAVHFEENNS